jgi:glycosyltransferase involved in cell wall biosynthesis
MKKLAVLLPSFNSLDFLRESIEAVLNQSFKEFHLYVIDDCSTDNTEQFVKGLMDDRIKYLKNDKNLGLSATLNKGLSFLINKYEYIARMDADDWCFPYRFYKQLSFLDTNKHIVLCGTQGYWLTDFEKNNVSNWSYATDHIEIKYNLLFTACFGHSSVIFRSSFLREYQLWYNEDIATCEDWDFWTRIIKIGEVANLPNYLMKYRIVEGSNHRSVQTRDRHLKEKSKVISNYWKSFDIKCDSKFIYDTYFNTDVISKKILKDNALKLIEMFNKLHQKAVEDLNIKSLQKLEYRFLRSILRVWLNSGVSRLAIDVWILIILNVKFSNKIKVIRSILK